MKPEGREGGRWNLEEEEEGGGGFVFLLPPAFSHTIGSKNSSFPSSERERDTWAEKKGENFYSASLVGEMRCRPPPQKNGAFNGDASFK